MNEEILKRCCTCKQHRPLNNFSKYREYRVGWEARNPGRTKITGRINRLKNYYHLTLPEFDRILEEQQDRCAICGTTDPGGSHKVWQIDHDHECCNDKKSCGRCVRGLLCWHCNVGLGLLKTKETLEKALQYIQTPTIRKRWSQEAVLLAELFDEPVPEPVQKMDKSKIIIDRTSKIPSSAHLM